MDGQVVKNHVVTFLKDEDGATAIEYGLLAALISVAIAGIAGAVGQSLIGTFTVIRDCLQTPAACGVAGGGSGS